MGKHK